jgi:hypothetical protein
LAGWGERLFANPNVFLPDSLCSGLAGANHIAVIPAQAGIHWLSTSESKSLGSGFGLR